MTIILKIMKIIARRIESLSFFNFRKDFQQDVLHL